MKKKAIDNKKFLYLLSILVSIYFTYLFTRLWNLSLAGILTILIFISFLIFYITKKVEIKLNDIIKIHSKQIVIVSIVLSTLTVISMISFFSYKYTSSEVELTGNNLSLNAIDSIVINNQRYLLDDNLFSSSYDKWHNKYIKSSLSRVIVKNVEENKITLLFEKSYNVKIFFNDDYDVKAKELNQEVKVEKINSTFMYEIQSNRIKDSYVYIRMVLSLFSLIYIYYLLVSMIFLLDNEKKGELIIILIGIIIGLSFFNNIILGYSTNDTNSYINFSFKKLLHFIPHKSRMPGYPIIVRIIKLIFDNNYIEFLCIFQYVFWICSLRYLYRIFILLTKVIKVSVISTIVYALCPAIISWNGIILTESIALSGTIIFIYSIIRYLKTSENRYGLLAIVLAFILTFIRPTSIIYLCGVFVFFILRILLKENNKSDKLCLKVNTLFLCFVFIYVLLFHHNYGIYSLNSLVVKQNFIVSIQEKYYKSSNDDEYIKNIDDSIKENSGDVWKIASDIMSKYSLNELKKHVSYTRNKNMHKYIKYICNLITTHAPEKFYGYSYDNTNPKIRWLHDAMYHSFSIITFLHIYIMQFMYIVWIFREIILRKRVNWIYLGFFAFPFIILFSSFIGTCGEFMRTAITSMQFTYISIVNFIYTLFTKGGKDEEIN